MNFTYCSANRMMCSLFRRIKTAVSQCERLHKKDTGGKGKTPLTLTEHIRNQIREEATKKMYLMDGTKDKRRVYVRYLVLQASVHVR